MKDVSGKANRMLGYVKRVSLDMKDPNPRKILYLALVRRKLGYCCPVWVPQTMGDILSLERIQRRATKFILSLPLPHLSYLCATTLQAKHGSTHILARVP